MRLGLHVQTGRGHREAIDYCARVKPAIMKWLEPSRESISECKRLSPNTRHVYRVYWPDQDLGDGRRRFDSTVVQRAREWRGYIDWIEGYNEFYTSDFDVLERFCRSEVDTARRINDAGVGAAIGGFSTGVMDTEGAANAYFDLAYANDLQVIGPQTHGGFWRATLPMLEYLHETSPVNVGHSHEYGGAYMQWGVRTPDGHNQWHHREHHWTGVSPDPMVYWASDLDGWWCLRYRMLMQRLRQEGLDGVRWILTETGIDDVNPRPGGQGKGWRDFHGTEWSSLPGIGPIWDQYYWYLWHASHDPFIAGIVDYGFGTIDPAWLSFDFLATPSEREQLIAAQLRLPEGHMTINPIPPPAPPTPPPVVVGDDVEPRIMVRRGEGWYSVVRRCGMKPTGETVAAMRAANPGVAGLVPGMWLRSPWHQVGMLR